MPLTMVEYGKAVSIHHITGDDHIKKHLANLGFVQGETVTVISKLGENVIIRVKDSRIALDKGMANRIHVM